MCDVTECQDELNKLYVRIAITLYYHTLYKTVCMLRVSADEVKLLSDSHCNLSENC